MSVTGGIMAGVGLAGSVASGAMGMEGADAQASAAEQAQELQAQEQEQALQFQEQEFNTQQANEAPFLKAGQGAVSQLSDLLSTPGQGLLTPWNQTFQAPTLEQAEQAPGYQFQLQQGEQALQNSASAQGELLDPNAARAEAGYAENLAQNDYQNVYNNAFTQYQTAYNTFQQNQANQFNRLAALSGVGQTATQQLGTEGQQAASNVGNIMLTGGEQQGQDIQNAAAATASGYTSLGNSINSGVNGISSDLLMSKLLSTNNPYSPGMLSQYPIPSTEGISING